MAILWGEKQQSRKASSSLEIEDNNSEVTKNTFEKVYIVIGDSPDEDMLQAVSGVSEIPKVGTREDSLGCCIGVEVVESDFIPEANGEGKPVYEVTVKYDTNVERTGGNNVDSGSDRDPKELWQQPDVQIPDYNLPENSIRWTFEQSDKKLNIDYNGRPLINVVGEKIDADIHYNLLVAEVTCYTLRNIEVEVLSKYNDTINNNVYAGYDPFRIKLNVSCDYEDIDLGDENHTICKWKKFVLKFTFDRVKRGTIKTETLQYHLEDDANADTYTRSIDTAGDEEFLLHVPHRGTKQYDAHTGDITTIEKDGVEREEFIDVNGSYSPTPQTITFQPYESRDFSDLSAYLDCDVEQWLMKGLKSNAGKHLESVMKKMFRKSVKRYKEDKDNGEN